jgi:glycosyltransferase involved in cell wall biosynthesis
LDWAKNFEELCGNEGGLIMRIAQVALLFPIDWPEPFGLVMIEAMACGTPVIAYVGGAVPEVIQQGTQVLSQKTWRTRW